MFAVPPPAQAVAPRKTRYLAQFRDDPEEELPWRTVGTIYAAKNSQDQAFLWYLHCWHLKYVITPCRDIDYADVTDALHQVLIRSPTHMARICGSFINPVSVFGWGE